MGASDKGPRTPAQDAHPGGLPGCLSRPSRDRCVSGEWGQPLPSVRQPTPYGRVREHGRRGPRSQHPRALLAQAGCGQRQSQEMGRGERCREEEGTSIKAKEQPSSWFGGGCTVGVCLCGSTEETCAMSLSRPSLSPQDPPACMKHQEGLVPTSQSHGANWRDRNQQCRKPGIWVTQGGLPGGGIPCKIGSSGGKSLRDGKNDMCRALAVRTFWQVWATAVKSLRPRRGQAGMGREARRSYVELTLYLEGPGKRQESATG